MGRERSDGGARVLGLDPGLEVTGYGVVEPAGRSALLVEGGVVRTRRTDPLELRLAALHEGVCAVLDDLGPSCVAVESLFTHYDRPATAIVMGHARGVLLLAAAQRGLAVTGYPPSRVKRALTGSGSATKAQVQRAVARALGLGATPSLPDVADALAVALCHADALRRGRPPGGSVS